MGDRSAIEWTDATWNPVTGCSHVSEGCRHCYAETLSLRKGWSKKPWTAPNAAENVVLHPDRLGQPHRWREPRRVFVNSMSDLFHELVPDEFIGDVFAVMAAAQRHTFQVLTKRPGRMLTWCRERLAEEWQRQPPTNIWLGVSAENQDAWDQRLELLAQVPAAVRFVSVEPLLGPIDCGNAFDPPPDDSPYQPIGWVIVGGESGPRFRPMYPAWVRRVRDQCVGAGVPFFFKQWGGRTPKAGGRELDGRTWDEMPTSAVPA